MTTLQRSLIRALIGFISGFVFTFLLGFGLVSGIICGCIAGLLAVIVFPLFQKYLRNNAIQKEEAFNSITEEEIKAIGRKETMKIVLIVFAGVLMWNALLLAFDVSNGALISKMGGYILQTTIIHTVVALIIPSVMAHFMGARASIQIIKNKKSKMYVGFKTVFFISIICIQLYLLSHSLLMLTTTDRTLSEVIIFDYLQGWTQFLFIIFWLPGAFAGSLLLGYFLGKGIGNSANSAV